MTGSTIPTAVARMGISGVVPDFAVTADIDTQRTETGIGALMPWAGKLWYISYTSNGKSAGSGTGLFSLDESFTMDKHPASVVGTYANRMIHAPSDQLLIGPHIVDVKGNVRTIHAIEDYLLTATFEHLHDPANKVYYLSMYGEMLEVDLNTLEAKPLFELTKELGVPYDTAHFKGGHTMHGRVVVASNTYEEADFEGRADDGRLAEWDGAQWTILEKKPFYEVSGRKNWGGVIFATGWDRASALLKVFVNGEWTTYRLPKPTHCFDHMWQTEWPRIREIETERFLMDCHGMFYELSPLAYSGKIWGVRPISSHLRVIPDYCSWRGLLVLSGNQVTPIEDAILHAGEPQSNLWFGKSDDLWQFGKPAGWGGPWWKEPVAADQPSDPYLMTGFDKKCVHFSHDADEQVSFKLEVDFLGIQEWKTYITVDVAPTGYAQHVFPDGFSAHWVRVTADRDCIATVYFHYT